MFIFEIMRIPSPTRSSLPFMIPGQVSAAIVDVERMYDKHRELSTFLGRKGHR